MTHLLTPADLDKSPWAACGQTALAALLERPLADMRAVFPPHTWVNIRQMQAALSKLSVPARFTPEDSEKTGIYGPRRWPSLGLVLLQFRGPWEAPGVPFAAALKHTHWVAVTPLEGAREPESMVFDVNALACDINHGWTPREYWATRILPPLIASHKRATGEWWVRAAIEVRVERGASR